MFTWLILYVGLFHIGYRLTPIKTLFKTSRIRKHSRALHERLTHIHYFATYAMFSFGALLFDFLADSGEIDLIC